MYRWAFLFAPRLDDNESRDVALARFEQKVIAVVRLFCVSLSSEESFCFSHVFGYLRRFAQDVDPISSYERVVSLLVDAFCAVEDA
jgi:hypothetical protein